MNRRAFTTHTLTAIAGLFGASRVSAEVERLQAVDERLEVLSEGLNKSTEVFGDDWPPVYLSHDFNIYWNMERYKNLDIVDEDGVSIPNIVVSMNEAENWIEMYPLELPQYREATRHSGKYRVTGLTRAQRIAHNDEYGSPFDANKLK